MGQYYFNLPDLGEGIVEAEIAALHVQVGDIVTEDQPLIDMMTDKATVELPSPVDGKILSISGQPGEMVTVGTPMVVFEVEGAGNADTAPAEAPKTGKGRASAGGRKAKAGVSAKSSESQNRRQAFGVSGGPQTGPGREY